MRLSLFATSLLCSAALSMPVFAQTAGNPNTPGVDKPAATAADTGTTPPAPGAAAPAASPEPPMAPAPDASTPSGSGASGTSTDTGSAPMPKKSAMKMGMHSGASNLSTSTSKSEIAPRLPSPKLGADAGPEQYLMAARHALMMKHTGEAQEALEMAETRALDRSTPADQAGMASTDPTVTQIKMALDSLGKKDMSGANEAIDKALGSHGMDHGQMDHGKMSHDQMGMHSDKPMHHKMKPMNGATPPDAPAAPQ